MRRLLIAVTLLLSGCATTIMDGFVGKPLQQVMVRYGPPANVFDMPDGRRAFQWNISSNYVVPGSSQSYTTANVYAPPGAFATVNATTYGTSTPGYVGQMDCLYTMYGQYDAVTKAWVLVGYEKPRLMCM